MIEQGHILQSVIPLSKNHPAFSVFRAIAVPMLHPETALEINWKLKTTHVAISRINKETAFSTENDLGRRIGSFRFQICLDMIAAEKKS